MDITGLLRTEAEMVRPTSQEWQEVARSAARRRRRRTVRLGGFLAVAIALVSTFLMQGLGSEHNGRVEVLAPSATRLFTSVGGAELRTQAEMVKDLLASDTPLFTDGQLSTIESAANAVGHPLYRPHVEGEPEVWLNPQTPAEAGLRYQGQLVVLYSQWPTGTDPAQRYSALASEWGRGYVTTIQGNPAWVVPSSAASDLDVGFVYESLGNTEVTLIAPGPIESTKALAGTLHG
jgi:hypothetical protein